MRAWYVIATASVALALSACQSKLDKSEEIFVNGCHDQGGETSVCTCIFDKLKDHYGADQLLDSDRRLPSQLPPDFSQSVLDAGAQCRA
ncbi:hypothetical protein P3T43_007161 [Paraburkholderia sp. GAS41]|uniref:hypothetical protein n=1 Tax=Paraburkholderia sp. GAS41 TaxID=3035134 RepID=UPI003D1F9557